MKYCSLIPPPPKSFKNVNTFLSYQVALFDSVCQPLFWFFRAFPFHESTVHFAKEGSRTVCVCVESFYSSTPLLRMKQDL
jgi:hypothetical protein